MEIDDISTSDCKIKIIFENLYDIRNKNYIEGVCLVINHWGDIICREYITKSPFEKGHWKQNIQIEHFEIIQEIERDDEKITLRGFSKETGNWMEYIIEKYSVTIEENNGVANLSKM
ncbi:MAG: hypothetical protein LBO21_01620 [Synergistaceae bacterium]|jgi:hypothetical protein|nr:hypothetical protein [Synergistaceae bacterium]